MDDYETRILSVLVNKRGESIFSERATTVSISDEAGGEFVTVEQHMDAGSGKIAIDPGEWPFLRDAIEKMIKECRPSQV